MHDQDKLHETNRYQDADFPVGVYTVTPQGIQPEGRGFRDLHWHEELQFTLVTDGRLTMRVNGDDHRLEQGQAIFINRDLLHVTTELSAFGRYVSINFPDKMLSFFAGSRMEQDCVTPYAGNVTLPALVYSPQEEWQRQGIACMEEIIGLLTAAERPPFWEYEAAMKCTQLWFGLISNCGDSLAPPSRGDVRRQQRIREMLAFIHEHYREPLTLAQTAAAAHVSEGECCRCFQAMVRKSPMQYLQSYRIARGQELLTGSDLSVTEIAYACGFGDSSHFIQYFRRQTGLTPRDYRKQTQK